MTGWVVLIVVLTALACVAVRALLGPKPVDVVLLIAYGVAGGSLALGVNIVLALIWRKVRG